MNEGAQEVSREEGGKEVNREEGRATATLLSMMHRALGVKDIDGLHLVIHFTLLIDFEDRDMGTLTRL